MNNSYLASIMVLSYNQEKYISQTIDSLLKQETSFAFEIVVGDDCSTDKTREILLTYQRQHPELLRLVPEAPNKGVVLNFRDTIKSCRGKYIGVCAGDDYWHDTLKLEKQVIFLEKNPDYGLVFSDINCFFENDKITLENYRARYHKEIVEGHVFEPLLTGKFFINSLTVCFLKSNFDSYVDFDEFIKAGFTYEDLPTWLELARHTQFKYLNESTATYRILNNSLSRPQDIKKKFMFLDEQYKIKKHFIAKYGVKENVAEKVEIYYHTKKFNLAYKWASYSDAHSSFIFLKKKGLLNPKLRLQKFFLQVPFLYRIIVAIKKIINPRSPILKNA
jgi:glycosyltransferase involved in cell wall biosynthesis